MMRLLRSLLQFLIGAFLISIVLMIYKYGGGRLFPRWDAVRLFRLSLFLCSSIVVVIVFSGIVRYYRKRVKGDDSDRRDMREDKR